jgi:hypothetical protein
MTDEKKSLIRVSISATCILDDPTLDLIDGTFNTDVVSIKDGEFFEPQEYMRKRVSLHVLEKLAESLKEELRDD